MFDLTLLGWGDAFAHDPVHDLPHTVPARVVCQERGLLRVQGPAPAALLAEVPGRLRHAARGPLDFPTIGDWVRVAPRPGDDRALIQGLYQRRSLLVRQAAGPLAMPQPLAANVEWALVVTSANRDFNPRRIERYLTTVWEGGARPVVLLNKVDLCDDPAEALELLGEVAPGVPVHAVSAATGAGLEALGCYLRPGSTVVVIGSSGVGKSTLVNRLLGHEVQAAGPVREGDDRGRHTTTRRDLLLLPGGGVLIDTPGLRELSPWASDEGLERAFPDLEVLAARCRFRDCEHEHEPGCAVQAGAEEGTIDPGRVESFRKLRRELDRQAARHERHARQAARRRDRQAVRALRKRVREKGGGE